MRRRRISQTQVDFLCLAVFGQRVLPDDMAERIALRREFAQGIAEAFERGDRAAGRRSSLQPAKVEAVA